VLTYPPQRRRLLAVQDLRQLRRFWDGQLVHRPISQPAELGLADLHAYQTARLTAGKAAATISNAVKDIVNLLRELAEQGQAVDASVCRLRSVPRPDSLPRHLSDSESQRLEAYVMTRDTPAEPRHSLENACSWVLAHTGLRARECVELQVQIVDSVSRRLTVREGKGRKDRVVYLSDVAVQALRHYLELMPHRATGPLWLRRSGRPITYQWLHARIVALGQAAGVWDLKPHRLRHTLTTRSLNTGMEVTRIQKLLGHQEIDTTMIYARVLDTTVETDYRRAMHQIEHQSEVTPEVPALASAWPTRETNDICSALAVTKQPLDNSV
jgi:site-specific recombinase XerD